MSAEPQPLLSVRDLAVHRRDGTAVVEGVSLDLRPGETIGIVGESGSGKSIASRALMGLLPPGMRADGEARFGGRDLLAMSDRELARVRGPELGMLYQDPFTMLNPLMRCGRHITEVLRDGRGKPLRKAAARAEVERRLAEVGIADPAVADRYPFQLSGGMSQRVGIAAALARDPQVLIADEPTTALDVTTQKEILQMLRGLQASRGMGLILITHDLRIAFSMSTRVYVFYAGGVLEVAPAAALEAEPLHPYSLGLLLSEPPSDHRVAQLSAIPGSVPDPHEVADRCRFAPRCRWAAEACVAGPPPLAPVEGERLSACVRLKEIRDAMREERRRGELAVGHEDDVSGDAIVQVRQLVKEFPSSGQGEPFRALDGVSVTIGANECVGLVGESGSGKTTLARCIVGLETPSDGRIEIAGVETTGARPLSAAERARVRQAVQIVFQDPYSSLNPSLTIGSTLKEAVGMREGAAARRTPAELLELVGLPGAYAARKPIALSGGERQRVAIARALAVEPRLVICDEAVSALDVSVQAQILNLLRELQRELGLSYLFVTHDLAVVRQVADRAYVLLSGAVVESGPIGQILDAPEHPYTRALVSSIPTADGDWLERTKEVSSGHIE